MEEKTQGKERWLRFAVGAGVLLLLAGLWWFSGVRRSRERTPVPTPKVATTTQPAPQEGILARGPELTVTAPDGRKEWRLRAREIRVEEKPARAFLEGVEAELYPVGAGGTTSSTKAGVSRGTDVTRVQATEAVLDWEGRTLTFTRGVVCQTATVKFTAPRLTWQGEPREFRAEGGVAVELPRAVARAQRLRLDAEGYLTMEGDVVLETQVR